MRRIPVVSVLLAPTLLAVTLTTSPVGASTPSDEHQERPVEEAEETSTKQESVEATFKEAIQGIPGLDALLTGTSARVADLVIGESSQDNNALEMASSTGTTLMVPMTGSNPVVMTRPGGMEFSVDLPGSASEAKVSAEGLVTFEDVHKDTHLILQAQRDTGIRMIAMIDSADAPTSLNFGFKATGSEKAKLVRDGSAAIVDDQDNVISAIAAPWAYDSLGNRLPSWYTFDGDTLILNVDHTMAVEYPVVADPEFTWGVLSGTAYFDRQETLDVAATSYILLSMFAPFLPPPFNGIVTWYVATIGGWAVTAANTSDKCLKVQYGFTWSWGGLTPGMSPGHYIDEAGITCS